MTKEIEDAIVCYQRAGLVSEETKARLVAANDEFKEGAVRDHSEALKVVEEAARVLRVALYEDAHRLRQATAATNNAELGEWLNAHGVDTVITA